MKLMFDLFPVILFFVAYKLADIYVATGLAILASVGQIAWLRLRGDTITMMQWMSLAIIVFFGGLTLLLRDEAFIKWKPTVLYLTLAMALAIGKWAFKRNLVESLMAGQIKLPARIWAQINVAWLLFFIVLAALNIWVAYTFSTDAWVNFKLFGIMGITFGFLMIMVFYMARHAEPDPEPESAKDETQRR